MTSELLAGSDLLRSSSDATELVSAEPKPRSGLLRATLWGTLIGSVVVFVFGAGTALAAGGEPIDALGLGAFAAFWGGPGFGGMIGASTYQGPDDHV